MIDSHCHLDQEPLFGNLNEVILRSKNAGITKLLTICTTTDNFSIINKIVDKNDFIFGTFGIHPHESEKYVVTKDNIINEVKNNDKIIGVGETGLDFYYNHSNKDRQIKSFKEHIEASIDLNIPVIVHSRAAENETYEILKSYKKFNPKILMHCFTGSLNFSNDLITLNSYFSASGIITFKNSEDLQKTFKSIPLEKLMIETDSPYLAPVPMRGKKNEPSFIRFTAEKLADLKKISTDKLIEITTKNFNKLFFDTK